MARILRMPALAANDSSSVLAGWPVPERTAFSASDPIATVETDKAVVDIEAETDGVLLKTLVPEGTTVAVGEPIALLGEPAEDPADLDALLAELGVAGAVAAEPPREQPGHAVVTTGEPRRFASPLARRLAREEGVPIEQIQGTGPAGRIVRRDVESALAQRAVVPATAVEHRSDVSSPSPRFTDRPPTRMRTAIASTLTASKQQIPHFYVRGTCRVDKLIKLRRQLNNGSAAGISLTDLLIKAVARIQAEVPALNVNWLPDAVRTFTDVDVDVAVAVATDGGLVTPVLRSVDALSPSGIAMQLRELAERARLGQLRQAEIEGGAITVTNLGMFGTEEFAAIINPPHAAILAVGAAVEQPIVKKGRLAVATLMRVTLSVDHRAVDGVAAAEWMRSFISLVEHPLRMLA